MDSNNAVLIVSLVSAVKFLNNESILNLWLFI